jgi:hypothetical protein
MKQYSILFEAAKKELDEEELGVAGTIDAPATAKPSFPIDAETDADIETSAANTTNKKTGILDILGRFDPNAGILKPSDNYVPTTKNKILKRTAIDKIIPDEITLEVASDNANIDRPEDCLIKKLAHDKQVEKEIKEFNDNAKELNKELENKVKSFIKKSEGEE